MAREQAAFLESYGKTLDSKSIGIDDVERFLDMFGPRQVAVAKRIQELDVKIAEAEKEYNEAQAKVYADARGAKRGTKITVTVLAETDGQAELMLTYGEYCVILLCINIELLTMSRSCIERKLDATLRRPCVHRQVS